MENKDLDSEKLKVFSKIAGAIRTLSMDAVQKANSGHPGLPMGCAEIGAYLYGEALNHNPKNPKWLARDRLVLSAGHGSMWLYSCLHLSGFKVSIDDIKDFRQLHSKTPGHPEYGETDGVEATTGPLGQGVGNAVGMALGLKVLTDKFDTKEHALFGKTKIFCLASDGDIMEGTCSEASSFAGHLKIDNLIVLYDANNICLDGPLSECCSEDTLARYKAYGWEIHEVDGYDFDALHATISHLREGQSKPALILCRTVIGKGAPNKGGTHKAHGAPLGEEELAAAKENLQLSQEPFYVPKAVESFFEEKLKKDKQKEQLWHETYRKWALTNKELAEEFEQMQAKALPENLEEKLNSIEVKNPIAGRGASHAVLNYLSTQIPSLIGGSADLSGSDMTMLKEFPIIKPHQFNGKNIKFGVREFAMGTMANGLSLTQLFIPFVGTFLTFSDYMRNSIRIAALSKIQVVYQFTHDSIFLGEDGPTHQPVEHYASLRALPNLYVIRPADSNEVKQAWLAALQHKKGPTALLLSRQGLPTLDQTAVPFSEGVGRGAYIVQKESKKPDYTLFATGSELNLALQVAEELKKRGKEVRVVSMPCWELFEKQDSGYRKSVIGGDLGKRVSIEAGVDLGWHKYIGLEGTCICLESFGASAPASVLSAEFGFQTDAILERILSD